MGRLAGEITEEVVDILWKGNPIATLTKRVNDTDEEEYVFKFDWNKWDELDIQDNFPGIDVSKRKDEYIRYHVPAFMTECLPPYERYDLATNLAIYGWTKPYYDMWEFMCFQGRVTSDNYTVRPRCMQREDKSYHSLRDNINYRFPLVVNNPVSDNISKISGLKQRLVNDICQKAKSIPGIISITIFGSSTTCKCHVGSDLDVAIKLTDEFSNYENFTDGINEFLMYISIITEGMCDKIVLNTIDENSELFENIQKEGVVVYEHTV